MYFKCIEAQPRERNRVLIQLLHIQAWALHVAIRLIRAMREPLCIEWQWNDFHAFIVFSIFGS